MEDLDKFEDDLIEDFKNHPVLKNLKLITDGDFASILLQRRYLSFAFTPAYDLVIDFLEDEEAKRIARVILREEYPDESGSTRSHREDMKEDLLKLGVSQTDIKTTRKTSITAQIIDDVEAMILNAASGRCADAQLLTILRFWGEVLVSVEYGQLWPRMEPNLVKSGRNTSVFYYPHYIHDAKEYPLSAGSSLLAAKHADQLGARLCQLLDTTDAQDLFKSTEIKVLQLRTTFYDQFKSMLS